MDLTNSACSSTRQQLENLAVKNFSLEVWTVIRTWSSGAIKREPGLVGHTLP